MLMILQKITPRISQTCGRHKVMELPISSQELLDLCFLFGALNIWDSIQHSHFHLQGHWPN
jgi:hypothetical protein